MLCNIIVGESSKGRQFDMKIFHTISRKLTFFISIESEIYPKIISASRHDVVVENLKDETFLIIDVVIPGNMNVIKKEVDKMRYKYLSIVIQRM